MGLSKIHNVLFADNLVNSPSQEKMSFKRMVDFVKGENDDNLKEMNRKLQRMLEETLTKNMHQEQVGSK